MLTVTDKHKVFLAIEPIDFRKGIDGIVALCRQQLAVDPQTGHFFIFRNKRGCSVKVLNFDSQGYWLCQKRLSTGRFKHWPKQSDRIVYLTPSQLHVLLNNGDPSLVNTSPPWKSIAD